MPIVSLSPSISSAISSILVILDACSVIKELVDNSLDAKATAISIEISSNALDIVQVKDNGSGIGSEDRRLVCKRSCTSKIHTIEDLRCLGGTSLGFRGEALWSIVESSGAIFVTTRIDGELVGEALEYDRAGELTR